MGWGGLGIGGTERRTPCGRRWRSICLLVGKSERMKEGGKEGSIKGEDGREGTTKASFHEHSTSTTLL